MPLDGKDYDVEKAKQMEEYRLERLRREEEARRERERQVNSFYQSLRERNPFEDSSSIATSQAPNEKTSKLSDKQKEAACIYFNDERKAAAKRAIVAADIKALRRILGPELFSKQQEIKHQSRHNLWQWLRKKCQLVLFQIKGQAMVDYLRENDFPSLPLKRIQQEELKVGKDEKREGGIRKLLRDAKIEKAIDHVINSWCLDKDSIKRMAKEKLRMVLQNAINELPSESFSFSREQLYDFYQRYEKLQSACSACHDTQTKLNALFAKLCSEESRNKVWQDFEKEMKQGMTSREDIASLHTDIQELKDSFFAECDLSRLYVANQEGLNRQSLLLDEALRAYVDAAESEDNEKKQKLLLIIELLLKHGDVPSTQMLIENLSDTHWQLIHLILKYVDTPTEFSDLFKRQLCIYANNRKETNEWSAARFFQWVMTRPLVTAQRQDDIRFFISIMCSDMSDLVLDNALAQAVQERATHAQRVVRAPSLYQALGVLLEDKKRGRIIAISVTSLEGMPMPTVKGTGTRHMLDGDLSDVEVLLGGGCNSGSSSNVDMSSDSNVDRRFVRW